MSSGRKTKLQTKQSINWLQIGAMPPYTRQKQIVQTAMLQTDSKHGLHLSFPCCRRCAGHKVPDRVLIKPARNLATPPRLYPQSLCFEQVICYIGSTISMDKAESLSKRSSPNFR